MRAEPFVGPEFSLGNVGSLETIAGEARRGLWLGRTWNRASSIQHPMGLLLRSL